MTTDFHFGASGWVRNLSPTARAEIERWFPTVPVSAVENEAIFYVLLRDAKHPKPGEARATLRELANQASELQKAMQPFALGPLEAFVRQAAWQQGTPSALADLRMALPAVAFALEKASKFIPEGRRKAPRHRLVRALAAILQAVDEAVETRPKGILCRLVDIVLRDMGEKPSDVRSIVESALGKSIPRGRRSSHKMH